MDVHVDVRSLQGGAPQVISWFIIPSTIDISPINHSYWSYIHQLSYLGGTTLWDISGVLYHIRGFQIPYLVVCKVSIMFDHHCLGGTSGMKTSGLLDIHQLCRLILL